MFEVIFGAGQKIELLRVRTIVFILEGRSKERNGRFGNDQGAEDRYIGLKVTPGVKKCTKVPKNFGSKSCCMTLVQKRHLLSSVYPILKARGIRLQSRPWLNM